MSRMDQINEQTVVEVEAPEYVYPEAEVSENTEAEEERVPMTRQELIERYATVQGISYEEAELQIGAPTEEEILEKIREKTLEKVRNSTVTLNRAQRRALKKKVGAKRYAEMLAENNDVVGAVSETARKLNYIDLIQKLRKMNKEKEENGETIIEDD